MSPILEAVGLSKSFLQGGQTRLILEGASLSLNEGEFLSIIGSSGCGKSTFLELLAGVTRPDRGRIIYRGEDVTGKGGKLGYMPQDDLLFPWLSVRENALLPARVANKDIRSAKKRIDELLPVFGLSEPQKIRRPRRRNRTTGLRWIRGRRFRGLSVGDSR